MCQVHIFVVYVIRFQNRCIKVPKQYCIFEAAPLDTRNMIYGANHPAAKDLHLRALAVIHLLNGVMSDEAEQKSVAVDEQMRDLTVKSAEYIVRKSLQSQQGI